MAVDLVDIVKREVAQANSVQLCELDTEGPPHERAARQLVS
eukprot:COSAG04_NODE_7944_length_1044_cov_0.980952_2_plen_41_part_00